MRPLLVLLALTAALLSGCAVEETPADATPAGGAEADPAPGEAQPAPPADEDEQEADAGPHGEPQVTEGAVTSGTDVQQVPAAWATRTVTVTNDFGGARLGDLVASVSAGSLKVVAADRDGYLVEAAITARAASEAEARAVLDRASLVHTDRLADGVLHLSDEVVVEDVAQTPTVAGITVIALDTDSVRVDLTITVPLGPAIALDGSTSSADIGVTALDGPRLQLSASSGDVTVEDSGADEASIGTSSGDVRLAGFTAGTLTVDTSSGSLAADELTVREARLGSSSGDLSVTGAIDSLDASTSSGDLDLELAPRADGQYSLDTSSGDVTLRLPADGHAYRVDAATSSGDLTIDIPDGEVLEDEEDRKEVASAGYGDAAVNTAIEASTSSGDVTVTAA